MKVLQNKFFEKALVVGLTFAIILSIPSNVTMIIHSNLVPTIQASSSEPLVPALGPIARTTSIPITKFFGVASGFQNITTTWFQNGTTSISDDRGRRFALEEPSAINSVLVLANSTLVDQKFAGLDINYDILWQTSKDLNGDQKLKFAIVGNSLGNTESTISLKIKQSSLDKEGILFDQNRFLVSTSDDPAFSNKVATLLKISPIASTLFERVKSSSVIDSASAGNVTIPQGLGIDWSDALSSGYSASFDPATLSIIFRVSKSFNIDPVVLDVSSSIQSPTAGDYSEGERRIVNIQKQLFAFYSINSYIYYFRSTNNGTTWTFNGGAVPEQVASDSFRWTIGTVRDSAGADYVIVYYYTQSGTTISYYAWRGQVGVNGITWDGAHTFLFSASVSATCACSAGVVATDDSGVSKIFAAFRWLTPSGTFNYKVMMSTNAGVSWTASIFATNSGNTTRIEMGLAKLQSGKMLFLLATYPKGEFSYKIYSGSSWGAWKATSGAGMSTNSVKEISFESDASKNPFVAYLAGGYQGTLKIAKWNSAGTFLGVETADSSKSHQLPSITIPADNILRIYSLSGGRIYETHRINAVWSAPVDAFGLTVNFVNPNQLTAAISYFGALWTENASPPYNVMFGGTLLNPYAAMGKYFPSYPGANPDTAYRFQGYNDFKGTSVNSLTTHVLSVFSVAGITGTNTFTNYNYQQVVTAAPNDAIGADPQVWSLDTPVWGCFMTGTCPVLLSPIGNLDYVYQFLSWDAQRTTVTFYSEAHSLTGGVTTSLLQYSKGNYGDTSTNFALAHETNTGSFFHTPQLGVESDIETYGWKVKQYNWQYYPTSGPVVDFSTKLFETVRAGDPQAGNTCLAPSTHSCVGTNPFDVHADYNCNNGAVPVGTINWSHASSSGAITGSLHTPWAAESNLCY